jgi:hypothetical protein
MYMSDFYSFLHLRIRVFSNFPELAVSDCAIVCALDVLEGGLGVEDDMQVFALLPGLDGLDVLQVGEDGIGRRTKNQSDQKECRQQNGKSRKLGLFGKHF